MQIIGHEKKNSPFSPGLLEDPEIPPVDDDVRRVSHHQTHSSLIILNQDQN